MADGAEASITLPKSKVSAYPVSSVLFVQLLIADGHEQEPFKVKEREVLNPFAIPSKNFYGRPLSSALELPTADLDQYVVQGNNQEHTAPK